MTAKKHETREHALLSASGASRWLACPPSARLEEKFEDTGSSDFAKEGTLAHEYSELELLSILKRIEPSEYVKKLKALQSDKLWSDEIIEESQKYVEYVLGQYAEAKKQTEGAVVLLEEKINYSLFVEEGFGTNDASIISDGTLEIIDLKYGKGLKVDADDNPQLKLYGLGALLKYDMSYDIKTVKLTIVQPRLDHISSWEISAKDLFTWAAKTVKPTAALAYEGGGIQKAGSHCRWCRAKAKCATLAADNVRLARHEFKDPKLLTDEQMIQVFEQIPQLTLWANAVAEHLLTTALGGKTWPGYKLVEGRSTRTWKDDEAVKEKLKKEMYDEADYMTSKLAGIGAIEKLVGKKDFNSVLGELVIKSEGKPTFVPESDKRPALNGAEQAKKDFE